MNINLCKCSSFIKMGENITIAQIEDVIEQLQTYNFVDGFVQFNIDDRIVFGKIEPNNIALSKDSVVNFVRLKSVRCFNHQQELIIFKYNSTFNCRFRKDTPGNDCEFIESSNVVFGTAKDESFVQPNFTKLIEDRGIEIILPIETNEVTENNRIKIVVRNYIGYNSFNQASFIDYRFVRFEGGKNE